MPRFFHPHPLSIGAMVDLPEHLAHHVTVLRLAVGDTITLVNGEGGEFTASVCEIAKRRASAEV